MLSAAISNLRDVDGRLLAAPIVCLPAMLAVAGWLAGAWRTPAVETPAAAATRELRECVDRLTVLMVTDGEAAPPVDCRDERLAYEAVIRAGGPAALR